MFGTFGWIIGIIVFIIIVALIWIFVEYASRGKDAAPSPYSFFISANPLIWDNGTPVTSPRGTCSLYVYPGATVSVNGNDVFQPPNPSLDPNVVNNLTPQSSDVACTDFDEQILALMTRTCQGKTGQTSFCINYDGSSAQPGDIELYYSSSNCSTPGVCYGTLGLFGLNFAPDPTQGLCIKKDTNQLKIEPCDPSNEKQIFRISRANPGVIPPTVMDTSQPQTTSSGIFAQFLDRDTGLCFNPVSNTVNSLTTLSICNDQYIWALIPYFEVEGGIKAPQQIAYVPVGVPPPDTTSSSDLANWIQTYNILSLSFNGDIPMLNTYNFDKNSSQGQKQTAQYLNYNSFSSSISVPICDNPAFANCSAF